MAAGNPALGWTAYAIGLALIARGGAACAQSIDDARRLYRTGQYEACVELADAEVDSRSWNEDWFHLLAESQITMGHYGEALETVERGLDRHPASIRMRLLAHRAYLLNDRSIVAEPQLDAVRQLLQSNPRRYRRPADRVAVGRFFLHQGADPRQVLEMCYDPLIRSSPDYVEGHLAAAELALSKSDRGLAAETLAAAPEAAADQPQYHLLVARAFSGDDDRRASEAVAAGLAINPRHIDLLLLQVENRIDGEEYAAARQLLEQVREINPHHARACSFRAVVAHLEGDVAGEKSFRELALSSWSQNPDVDHTIGRKLSDKYRFAEGAAYQRQALKFQADYLPARMQLAQDLLRLGEDAEGWQLIDDVFQADGYNVVAHNLTTLHDSLQQYQVLANEWFRIRMEAREARLYGQQVLALLNEARETLCEKYDVTIDEPVVVEIFPQQKDFAVRTFGIPGADGFLGVCFGKVITANSPAALGATYANWKSVLWHEYCHAVTLQKSHNKMPRWLSEGISVYEELERHRGWGQRLTPAYRQFILSGEMAPLSKLSSLFLAPKSPQHLQFAYFESAMAVEFLVERYGLEAIKNVLDSLGEGDLIEQALIEHVAPLGKLDAEFDKHMRAMAGNLAPGLSWNDFEAPPDADADQVANLLRADPDNFQGLIQLAQTHLQSNNWEAALQPANRLRELFPEYVEAGNAYLLLARAYRELGDVDAEREALAAWAERDGDAVAAFSRLLELAVEAEDWEAAASNAQRLLAVNPLTPAPHRSLARAAEALDRPAIAIGAYRALLEFDTTDHVQVHYRLSRLLAEQGDATAARREALMALEDAPRFRAAHRQLLELTEGREHPNQDSGAAAR